MQTLRALLHLIRYPNLLIIAITQFLVAYAIIDAPLNLTLVALIVSTVLVAASGNIINDYFDVRFDHINKPHEIWVGKYFTRRTILILHWVVSVISVGIGIYASIYVGMVNILCVALLWFYSQKFKCVPYLGNLIVAFLTGLVVLIMALKYGFYGSNILVYIYFSFLVNLIREITKDMEDIRGDYFFDCRTIATVNGIAYTKRILVTLEFILIGSFLLLMGFVELRFQIYIAVLLLPISILLILQTWYAHKKKHFKILSRLEKLLILLGVLSMILFKLEVLQLLLA